MKDDTSQRPAPHRPEQAGLVGPSARGAATLLLGLLLGLVSAASGQDARPRQPAATKPTATKSVATKPPATKPAATTRPANPPTTSAATAPTTTPATAPAPPPGPKAVALAFAAAVDRGDAAAARALTIADPAHGKWVDSTVKLAASLKKLDAAATAKWGEAGRKVSQNAMGLTESMSALRLAQEKVEGDLATLTQPGAPEPALRLRRVTGGAWRVETPQRGAELVTQLKLHGMLREAAERTTVEVTAGAFTNADEAAAAFARRVLRARIRAV